MSNLTIRQQTYLRSPLVRKAGKFDNRSNRAAVAVIVALFVWWLA